MGILGVGVDLVEVSAFREQLALPGSRFAEVFTPRERRSAEGRADGDIAAHLSVRWAAKEAVIKAWSAALFGQPPVIEVGGAGFQEIEVIQDRWNRPAIRLNGQVLRAFESSMSALGNDPKKLTWHLSLTHDGNYASATVLLTS
ncbi:MAG: holo-ACP synthase [Actinomycetaceae bacterium]|nr:holo-ACP synthase [Actinomycetaceae bacterium]